MLVQENGIVKNHQLVKKQGLRASITEGKQYPSSDNSMINIQVLSIRELPAEADPWKNAGGTPMIEPMAINGKVYISSDGQLSVFGL